MDWMSIAGLGAGLLGSLFGKKKSGAAEQEEIMNKRQPFISALWEPSKNPGLRTQMQLGPSNQFNWDALASRMTPGMLSLLETVAPQYQGYTPPDKWGQPGTGTGGATGAGNNMGNINLSNFFNPFTTYGIRGG